MGQAGREGGREGVTKWRLQICKYSSCILLFFHLNIPFFVGLKSSETLVNILGGRRDVKLNFFYIFKNDFI